MTPVRSSSSRRIVVFAAALVWLSLLGNPLSSVAAQEAQPAVPRIAIVNLEAVFLSSPDGTKLANDLQALQDDAQKTLDGHIARLGQLEQSLATATQEEAISISRQQEDEERKGRRVQEEATRKAAKLEQDSRTAFNAKVQPIFAAIQKEREFDLILNKAPGVVIFAGPSLEITAEVLQRLTGESPPSTGG